MSTHAYLHTYNTILRPPAYFEPLPPPPPREPRLVSSLCTAHADPNGIFGTALGWGKRTRSMCNASSRSRSRSRLNGIVATGAAQTRLPFIKLQNQRLIIIHRLSVTLQTFKLSGRSLRFCFRPTHPPLVVVVPLPSKFNQQPRPISAFFARKYPPPPRAAVQKSIAPGLSPQPAPCPSLPIE